MSKKEKRVETLQQLERRQEDARGALTRGAWLWIERLGDTFLVETSVLSRSVGDHLASLGFEYDRDTGRFFAKVSGEVALRRVGAAALAILAEELP